MAGSRVCSIRTFGTSKRKDEAEFRAAVMANPQWKATYGSAWDQIAQAEKKAATRLKERWFHSTAPT